MNGEVKVVNMDSKSDGEEKKRDQWSSKWEFLLSCVGLSVGIGNVWRFPYLAYENGGGAFLIPYLIMLFIAGKPMYFLELAIGQFASRGPISIWKCAPIAKGVGVAMILSSIIVCIYYNVIMSYALYFIAMIFQKELPWTRCDESWTTNTTKCVVGILSNSTSNETVEKASQLFWEREVLDLSDGIENLGGIKWDLALCLFISWVVVVLCLLKGVKSSGKVVYFAATFPYLILLALLIAGFTQKGSLDGVIYFLKPQWRKLLEIKVWQNAASQMFYSLSLSTGGLIMYGSYNDFKHNIYKDAMIVSILDTLTSIIAGLVIFSVLGAMSFELGVPIDSVVKGGPGLAFVAYPEALSRLPWPHFWSFLFFIMLFMLGLDSEFAILESVMTSFADEIKFVRQHKMGFTVLAGFLCFLLGLPCVTRGGQYVIEVMDYYGGGVTLLFIAVFEIIAFSWVYGYRNVARDIQFMLDRKLGFYWRATWQFTAPVILSILAIFSLINHERRTYGKYVFPAWSEVVGWLIITVIIAQFLIWAIVAVIRQKNCETIIEKFTAAVRPDDKWGPKLEHELKKWKMYDSTEFELTVTN